MAAAAVALMACAAPAGAQQAPKLVGILSPFAASEPGIDAFRRELARLGGGEGNPAVSVEAVHGRLEGQRPIRAAVYPTAVTERSC